MSMPHAPPTPPPVIPIGHYYDFNADAVGETNFLVGAGFLVITLFAVAHFKNVQNIIPLPVLIFVISLVLLVLRLVNKRREIRFITDESHRRNYLTRFAYPAGVSAGLILTALFILLSYQQHWTSLLTSAGLAGIAFWNLKSPGRNQPFSGTNGMSDYWRRITGEATFSQLDYGPGDTVTFSYVDGLVRDDRRYHVFLNRVKEFRVASGLNDSFWSRKVLWSIHRRASPDQLSKGLNFKIPEGIEKELTSPFYHLLYWEVVIQEIDSPFTERFLVGMEQVREAKRKRLKSLVG